MKFQIKLGSINLRKLIKELIKNRGGKGQLIKKSVILNAISLCCTQAILFNTFWMAAPAYAQNSNSLRESILKAKILAPGTNVKVRLAGDKASVSTFRNKRATDKDCKIEAVLIAKTIFDAPQSKANSISVFFYNSRNPAEYKSVNVTKGDVAAFGSGDVSKSELLSSIQIREGGMKDPAAAIENQLMLTAASKRTDVQISMNNDEITVTTSMPSDTPQREYKYEALRLAEIATEKLGNTGSYKRVVVNFFNPGKKGDFKQITVSTQQLETLNNKLLAALNSMYVVKKIGKVSAKDVEPQEGLLLKERKQLLAGIIELEELGAGVAPFVKAFQAIENQVSKGDEEALSKSIERLYKSVVDQKAAREDAKNRKLATNNDKTADSDSDSDSDWKGDAVRTKKRGKIKPWAFGYFKMLDTEILRNPDRYLKVCIEKFNERNTEGLKAQDSPKYVYGLLWFAEVLKTNKRPDEAKKFENMAARANARIRSLKRK